jgi:tRNA G10  N-methylase Trm11
LGRNAIGLDISRNALAMTNARLKELKDRAPRESLFGLPNVKVSAKRGDARELTGIPARSVDLICTHPPYGNALGYTHDERRDLSLIKNPTEFMDQLELAGRRFWEVLKPEGYCAIVIGDMRSDGKLYTFGFELLTRFNRLGFATEDIVIKTQSKDRSTEFFFKSESLRLRLAHEYLFVFKKPITSVSQGTRK